MATENELIIIADLIVGLREKLATTIQLAAGHLLTVEQRDTQIAELEKKLADEKQAMQDLIAEADALRHGIALYRAVTTKNHPGIDYSYLDEWEDTVGSIIWPRKMAVTVARVQQPWRDGEVPSVLEIIGIEWEIERTSGDYRTDGGFVRGQASARHRPVSFTWDEVYRRAAAHLGKQHCLTGARRLEDAEILAELQMKGYTKATAVTSAYHKAYSDEVEFFHLDNVTEAAACRALKTDIGGRREYLEQLNSGADHQRPFRFIDSLGRPISWTMLDKEMPASGMQAKPAAKKEKPGYEFRPCRALGLIPTVPGVVWEYDDEKESARPSGISWDELRIKIAKQAGAQDALQGEQRLRSFDLTDPLRVTQSRDAVAAYQKAYTQTIRPLPLSKVTAAARSAAQSMGAELITKGPLVFYRERKSMYPIAWRFLDRSMEEIGISEVPTVAPVSEPQAEAATVKPEAEFRQGLRPKVFAQLADIIWDDQRSPHFASRPVNSTWAEVQRRAAEILGREDCLAGRERLTSEGVYEAVGMTHDDRAKTDAAAVAYQEAYSEAVVRLRDEDVSEAARVEAGRRDAVRWFDGAIEKYFFSDRTSHLPISWRQLDPDMDIKKISYVMLRDSEPGPSGTVEIEMKDSPSIILVNEFRRARFGSGFPSIPGVVWEHNKDRDMVRPANMTWTEMQRRGAEVLGKQDARAGRERMPDEAIVGMLDLTAEDRAKFDSVVAYNMAYTEQVPYLDRAQVTYLAAKKANELGAIPHSKGDTLSPFVFVDRRSLPISWRLLDPDMGVAVYEALGEKMPAAVPRKSLGVRGGAAALGILLQVFYDGPSYCAPLTERGYIDMLREDGLVVCLHGSGLALTDDGKKVLAENMKNLLLLLSE